MPRIFSILFKVHSSPTCYRRIRCLEGHFPMYDQHLAGRCRIYVKMLSSSPGRDCVVDRPAYVTQYNELVGSRQRKRWCHVIKLTRRPWETTSSIYLRICTMKSLTKKATTSATQSGSRGVASSKGEDWIKTYNHCFLLAF